MAGLFGTRAQVGALKQTSIQPTGIPGSTFVRPQERRVGGNASALAEALGGLNTALQNFATVKAVEDQDPQSRANQEWIARRQQMGLDQLREEAKNGTPDGIRIREDALNAMLGERANDDFRKAWLEFYNDEFDRTSGDAATEYERMRQEFAAGLPTEIARGSFYRLTKDHFSAWMQKDVEEKVSYAKQELNTTVVDSFRNSIDDARGICGKSAADAARIVFAKSASNRDFLGLSGAEQNETIFQTAQAYALAGDEEMARALLETARPGAGGKTIPALSTVPAYAEKSFRLIEQASITRRKEARKSGLSTMTADEALVDQGAFTEAEAEKRKGGGLYSDDELADMVGRSRRVRLATEAKWQAAKQKQELKAHSEREEDRLYAQAFAAMGRFGGINQIRDIDIPSPTGEGFKTVSRQQQIDAVVRMKEADFTSKQEELVKSGTAPEDARAQVNRLRVDWYAGNKIVNEEWQNTLNGIAGRASMDTLLQKGEVTAYLKDSAKLYRDLKATNPAYLSNVLTDAKSREFLEAYDNAVSNRRMPEDEALTYAAHVTAQPENLKAKSMISRDDADKLARSTLRGLGVDERSSNYAYVMDRVSNLSANGLTDKEIKRKIEEDILSTAVPINGMLVFDHRDLPDDFPELMQEEIKARFEARGKDFGITDPNDLYAVADGSETKWYVMSKSLGGLYPIGSEPITPQMLEARRGIKRAAQEDNVRKLVQAKDAERARLKAEYDADIERDRARIAFWRSKAGTGRGLSKAYADTVADDLERQLDDRMARDRDRIFLTPQQRMKKATDKILPPDEVEAWKKRNGIGERSARDNRGR